MNAARASTPDQRVPDEHSQSGREKRQHRRPQLIHQREVERVGDAAHVDDQRQRADRRVPQITAGHFASASFGAGRSTEPSTSRNENSAR